MASAMWTIYIFKDIDHILTTGLTSFIRGIDQGLKILPEG